MVELRVNIKLNRRRKEEQNKMSAKKVFLTVDFECLNRQNMWFAFCAMVAEYPSGKILDMQRFGCERPESAMDEATRVFWEKHNKVYTQLRQQAHGKNVEEEELKMCQYITDIITEYPQVHVALDNPQYDNRLLDNLLQRHNFPPIAMRPKNTYFQSVCTWSFHLGVFAVLKRKPKDLEEVYQEMVLDKTDVSDEDPASKDPSQDPSDGDMPPMAVLHIDDYFGPRHTPQADCARILSQHFKVMNILAVTTKT